MQSIGELFTLYGSDKDSDHGYGKYYDKHLPKEVNKLLEIGTWKGGSIKAFQEYYRGKGQFHTINYIFGGEIISEAELAKYSIVAHRGMQEDITFLCSIKDKFTVIVDDGSHHSDAQIISFKQLFVNNLESGGLYVIEDVYGHLEGEEGKYWRRGNVNTAEDTIMEVIKKFVASRKRDGQLLVTEYYPSQFFTEEESYNILSMIDHVDIYDNKIIFIKKA